MGQKKQRRLAFFEKGLECIFCGGGRIASEIDHVPPRVLFLDKQRPKGLEFPACEKCNRGSSKHDQVAALITKTAHNPLNEGASLYDGDIERLITGVNNNSRSALDALDIHQEPTWLWRNGKIHEMFAIPVREHLWVDWLNPWAAKLGLALYYEHTNSIVPPSGQVVPIWFGNREIASGKILDPVINAARILPSEGSLRNGRRGVEGQFYYKYGFSQDRRDALFLCIFHGWSGCLTFVSLDENRFDGIAKTIYAPAVGIPRRIK